ncbi:hypothetical protein QAD02_022044 [Eretmocerus hayati]|uniref:Uncharacterized protein n=1 Tax=Eretmocerus hayati TaxID=131215 RepID=A0ACC2PWS3_9HYME|nr:hypothetical protein QAD02_022044 [Eretmocerus hayati]
MERLVRSNLRSQNCRVERKLMEEQENQNRNAGVKTKSPKLFDANDTGELNIEADLKRHFAKFDVPHNQVNHLRGVLKPYQKSLPLHHTTLFGRDGDYNIEEIPPDPDDAFDDCAGFVYFGMTEHLRKTVNTKLHPDRVPKLQFRFDGKLSTLEQEGIEIDGLVFKVEVICVVADTRARAFIKVTEGQTDFCCCERCRVMGFNVDGRTIFLQTKTFVETDSHPSLYGLGVLVINSHNLLLLADDVEHLGCSLVDYSAFCFKNILGKLEVVVESGNKSLIQL